MLKCDQPEESKKTYTIPKVSKKRQAQIDSGEWKPKERKPIAPRSDKRAKQEREYSKLSTKFKIDNPVCQARIKCLGKPSAEVHHKAGRVGKLLTDVAHFIALCVDCHHFAENNPTQAKALGISTTRIDK